MSAIIISRHNAQICTADVVISIGIGMSADDDEVIGAGEVHRVKIVWRIMSHQCHRGRALSKC